MPKKPEPSVDEALIEVADLSVHFRLGGSALGRLVGRDTGAVRAVDGVSFTLARGEVLGLVGESGSGKSTLGRALLGLVRPTGGQIRYRDRDIGAASERALRALRRDLQMVFQDPHAALNPAMDLQTAVGHPLRVHRLVRSRAELRQRVVEALEHVGLTPAEQFLTKYPADLSGGQKQRAVIARAIISRPSLLVADEPVSMLDMSVRAKILELMRTLRRDLGLTYLYITHDLATAKFFCDRVAICYLGRIVEIGPTEQIFAAPRHPYTRALLRAIPEPDPDRSVARDLPRGEIPDAARPPLGCAFHPRCRYAFAPCGWEARDLRALLEQRWTQIAEERYRAERALFADLAELDSAGRTVRIRAATGASGQDLVELFDEIRAGDPDEPLWRGVRGIRAERSAARVEFMPGEDPRLLSADAVDVACHLFDDTYAADRPAQDTSAAP